MEMACFGLHACSVSDKVGTGPSSKQMQCPIEAGGLRLGALISVAARECGDSEAPKILASTSQL
jgi:hypothetical protein